MLLLDGQVHHDTHVLPMGNYVIGVGNYVIATPSELGNYEITDTDGGEAGTVGQSRLTGPGRQGLHVHAELDGFDHPLLRPRQDLPEGTWF